MIFNCIKIVELMERKTFVGVIQRKEEESFHGSFGQLIISGTKFYVTKKDYYKYRLGFEVELEYTKYNDSLLKDYFPVQTIRATGKDIYSHVNERVSRVPLTEVEKEMISNRSKDKPNDSLYKIGVSFILSAFLSCILFLIVGDYYFTFLLIHFLIIFYLIEKSSKSAVQKQKKITDKSITIVRFDEIVSVGHEEDEFNYMLICYCRNSKILYPIKNDKWYELKGASHFAIHNIQGISSEIVVYPV